MATAIKNFTIFNRKITITVQNILSKSDTLDELDSPGGYEFDKEVYNKYMKNQLKPQMPLKWQFNKIG